MFECFISLLQNHPFFIRGIVTKMNVGSSPFFEIAIFVYFSN